ncbi:MAG: sigma-70 family RNA polymerase sigma factor [Clostridiales bacterium]|jgi:RNA polymerase sigma-70 factor (ECF subfamily)|nr:sigma-70 family RNA polymerase sigma factor [Clostridiales bacterium]
MSEDGNVTQEELEQIVSLFKGPLFWYAQRVVNNKQDAEEIVNDVFYRLFCSFDKNKGNPKNWLYTVTKHLCYDRLKMKNIEQVALTDYTPVTKSVDRDKGAIKHHVREIVDTLDERYQALYALRFEHRYTYEEIGEILCVKSGTVGFMIYKLKTMIKEKLES